MSKFTPSIGSMSGKMGGLMFSSNRKGSYVRISRKPTNSRTAAQTNNRSVFGNISQSYSAPLPPVEMAILNLNIKIPFLAFRTVCSTPILILPALPANQYYGVYTQTVLMRKPAGAPQFNFDTGSLAVNYSTFFTKFISLIPDIQFFNGAGAVNILFSSANATPDDVLGQPIYLSGTNAAGDANSGVQDVDLSFAYSIFSL